MPAYEEKSNFDLQKSKKSGPGQNSKVDIGDQKNIFFQNGLTHLKIHKKLTQGASYSYFASWEHTGG